MSRKRFQCEFLLLIQIATCFILLLAEDGPEKNPKRPYSFSYSVSFPEENNFQGHIQSRNDEGSTSGSYYILSPDGLWRHTKFGDEGFGYSAVLSVQDSPPSGTDLTKSQSSFATLYHHSGRKLYQPSPYFLSHNIETDLKEPTVYGLGYPEFDVESRFKSIREPLKGVAKEEFTESSQEEDDPSLEHFRSVELDYEEASQTALRDDGRNKLYSIQYGGKETGSTETNTVSQVPLDLEVQKKIVQEATTISSESSTESLQNIKSFEVPDMKFPLLSSFLVPESTPRDDGKDFWHSDEFSVHSKATKGSDNPIDSFREKSSLSLHKHTSGHRVKEKEPKFGSKLVQPYPNSSSYERVESTMEVKPSEILSFEIGESNESTKSMSHQSPKTNHQDNSIQIVMKDDFASKGITNSINTDVKVQNHIPNIDTNGKRLLSNDKSALEKFKQSTIKGSESTSDMSEENPADVTNNISHAGKTVKSVLLGGTLSTSELEHLKATIIKVRAALQEAIKEGDKHIMSKHTIGQKTVIKSENMKPVGDKASGHQIIRSEKRIAESESKESTKSSLESTKNENGKKQIRKDRPASDNSKPSEDHDDLQTLRKQTKTMTKLSGRNDNKKQDLTTTEATKDTLMNGKKSSNSVDILNELKNEGEDESQVTSSHSHETQNSEINNYSGEEKLQVTKKGFADELENSSRDVSGFESKKLNNRRVDSGIPSQMANRKRSSEDQESVENSNNINSDKMGQLTYSGSRQLSQEDYEDEDERAKISEIIVSKKTINNNNNTSSPESRETGVPKRFKKGDFEMFSRSEFSFESGRRSNDQESKETWISTKDFIGLQRRDSASAESKAWMNAPNRVSFGKKPSKRLESSRDTISNSKPPLSAIKTASVSFPKTRLWLDNEEIEQRVFDSSFSVVQDKTNLSKKLFSKQSSSPSSKPQGRSFDSVVEPKIHLKDSTSSEFENEKFQFVNRAPGSFEPEKIIIDANHFKSTISSPETLLQIPEVIVFNSSDISERVTSSIKPIAIFIRDSLPRTDNKDLKAKMAKTIVRRNQR